MAKPICSVDQCDRPSQARGLCTAHHLRWRRTGVWPTTPVRSFGNVGCQVEGCDRPYVAIGFCELHRARFVRTGDPLKVNPKYRPPRKAAPTFEAIHRRLWRDRGKASTHPCAHCGKQAKAWAYDWLDDQPLVSPKGSLYSLDQSHYMPLCWKCHQRFDWWPSRNKSLLNLT